MMEFLKDVATAVAGALGVCALGLGIAWVFMAALDSDWNQKRQAPYRAAEAAQALADQQPRVIGEADGCKVYAFKSAGLWHNFTRCPVETTTDTTHQVRQGKRTETRVESVVVTDGEKP